jgi:hypothetical protein
LTNGELLNAAERAGFELLVTVAQNIPNQQNLSGRMISLLILQSRTTSLDDLIPLVPDALSILTTIRPGEVVYIGRR